LWGYAGEIMSRNTNLAILAHVDAGKTTLSERILFASKEISTTGEVDDGLATMDYLADEKERGITIETGVHSFFWKKRKFSLLDTPGHIDFSVEVDQALMASDFGVLVLSSVRGVETQSFAGWEKLDYFKLPRFVFINKLDSAPDLLDNMLLETEEAFGKNMLVLSWPIFEEGRIIGSGDALSGKMICHDGNGREQLIQDLPQAEHSQWQLYYKEIVECASAFNDEVMENYLEGEEIPVARLVEALGPAFDSEEYLFCYCGSALKNCGVRQLITGFSLFSRAKTHPAEQMGSVLQYRRVPGFEGVYIFHNFHSLSFEDWPQGWDAYALRAQEVEKISSLEENELYMLDIRENVYEPGDVLNASGDVLKNVWEGEYLSLVHCQLELKRAEDMDALGDALKTLAKADPSLKVEYRSETGCWIIFCVGEVHRDVVLSRLKREFQLDVLAGEPRAQCIEKLNCDLSPQKIEAHTPLASLSFSAELKVLESESVRVIMPHGTKDIWNQVVESSIEELAEMGVRGQGALTGFAFCINELRIKDECPPGLLKKMVYDFFKLHVSEKMVGVYEPLMHLDISVGDEYCGRILADIESRGGKIRLLDSDGLKTKIFSEIPLQKVFGYSIIVRSISKGTASYALRIKEYRKIS
jgi:elongation factor G